jgi:hypothetical protein
MLWIYIFTNLPVFRKTAKGFELMNCSKLASVLILLILAASTAYALVPPHPSYRQIPTAYRRTMPELAQRRDLISQRRYPEQHTRIESSIS